MLVELPSFRATGDATTMLEERKCENGEKKNMENNCYLMPFFCSVNSKKNGENNLFLFSKKSDFENTKNKKNKNNFLNQTSF